MSDIVERLRNEPNSWSVIDEAADVIESLRQRVAQLEEHLKYWQDYAQGRDKQLAACEKEREELRELAKWREKYSLTGYPEIYDNPSAEFHKWACETHDGLKVGADETAEQSAVQAAAGGLTQVPL